MDIHAPLPRGSLTDEQLCRRAAPKTASCVHWVNWCSLSAAQGLAPFANMVLAAHLLLCRPAREESRGGHFRSDFPKALPRAERNHFALADLQAGIAGLPQEPDTKSDAGEIPQDGQRHG